MTTDKDLKDRLLAPLPPRKVMSQHTPGPWKAVENKRERTVQIDTEKGTVVQPGAISWRPDVYLITAAPALLEALEGLVARLDDHFGSDQAQDWKEQEQARAAILAAKGDKRGM